VGFICSVEAVDNFRCLIYFVKEDLVGDTAFLRYVVPQSQAWNFCGICLVFFLCALSASPSQKTKFNGKGLM